MSTPGGESLNPALLYAQQVLAGVVSDPQLPPHERYRQGVQDGLSPAEMPEIVYTPLPEDVIELQARGLKFLENLGFPIQDPLLRTVTTNDRGIMVVTVRNISNSSQDNQTVFSVTPYGENAAEFIGALFTYSGLTSYLADPSQLRDLEMERRTIFDVLDLAPEDLTRDFNWMSMPYLIGDNPKGTTTAGSLRILTELARVANSEHITVVAPYMSVEITSSGNFPALEVPVSAFLNLFPSITAAKGSLGQLMDDANGPAEVLQRELEINYVRQQLHQILAAKNYPLLEPVPYMTFTDNEGYFFILDFLWPPMNAIDDGPEGALS